MVNTKTKNTSFIKMWRVLQDLNVTNNDFMLQLNDERLKDFDISDLDTDDRKVRELKLNMVIEECKSNVWFFFREVIRIGTPVELFDRSNISESRFILNQVNMAMIFLYSKEKSFIFPSSDRIIGYGDKKSVSPCKYGGTTTILLLELYEKFISRDISVFEINMSFGNCTRNISQLVNQILISNYKIFPTITIDYDYEIYNHNFISYTDQSLFRLTHYLVQPTINGENTKYFIVLEESCTTTKFVPSDDVEGDMNNVFRYACIVSFDRFDLLYDDLENPDSGWQFDNRIFIYKI